MTRSQPISMVQCSAEWTDIPKIVNDSTKHVVTMCSVTSTPRQAIEAEIENEQPPTATASGGGNDTAQRQCSYLQVQSSALANENESDCALLVDDNVICRSEVEATRTHVLQTYVIRNFTNNCEADIGAARTCRTHINIVHYG